jgi:iron(III) transport system ATP-binding protein
MTDVSLAPARRFAADSANPATTKLEVDDLHLSYGDNAILKGVSMQLAQGEVVSLLGPSGSGKTTLLRAVAGLEAAHRGTIRIEDRPVFDAAARLEVPAEKRNLGLVFQSYALWPHRTVFDNVAYGLKLRGTPSAETRARVEEVLGQLGLGALGERFPHQLSGGQQQRVALARALVYSPRLILLDEPLSNLDAKLREEARIWFRQLIQRLELSALYVTHDQVEAMAVADHVLVLENGAVEQEGTPQRIYDEPSSAFTADFMGVNNRFSGRVAAVEDGLARLAGDGWELWGERRGSVAPSGTATGFIRVERVRVAEADGPDRLSMRLETSLFLGERWEHQFRRGGLTARAWTEGALADGEYFIEFPRRALWIF